MLDLMYIQRSRILIVSLMLAFITIGCDKKRSTDTHEIPVETFFRNPDESNFQLSPNGENLLFLKRTNHRLNLFVRNLQTNIEKQLTQKESNDIEIFYWVNDDRIVYVDDIEGKQSCQLYAINRNGTGRVNLAPFSDIRVYIIDGKVFNKAEILVSFNQRGASYFDVYRINTETGAVRCIAENNGRITKWLADNDGVIRIAIETDGLKSNVLYRDAENQPFRKLFSEEYLDRFIPLSFQECNKKFYALSNLKRDKLALVSLDPAKPEFEQVIFENPNVDISEYTLAQHTQQLVDVRFRTNKLLSFCVNQTYSSVYKKLNTRFPNMSFQITSSDRNEKTFVFKVFNEMDPGTYYLLDISKGFQFRPLSVVNDGIAPEKMAKSQLVYIPVSDGQIISASLTMPQLLPNGSIPFVVYLSQTSTYNIGTFDPLAQYLSNRGFGVLEVHYRGINGFGKNYKTNGNKDHYSRSLGDIIESTEWLIRNGYAKQKKISVYGAFYGGFAAMNAVIKRPDLYGSGVSYAGFYNLFSYVEGIPEFFKPYQMMLFEMIGNPKIDSVKMRESSPFFMTHRIVRPVFIYQGKNDPRVNYKETSVMVNLIKQHTKDTEYMLVSNEGRGMRKEENRMEFYKQLEKFLNKTIRD